jgi:hypothetical protein
MSGVESRISAWSTRIFHSRYKPPLQQKVEPRAALARQIYIKYGVSTTPFEPHTRLVDIKQISNNDINTSAGCSYQEWVA